MAQSSNGEVGKGLHFYVITTSPYTVRIRYGNVGNPIAAIDANFDWQMDVTAADWVALIAAITAAVGTAGASYTLPNATYVNDIPRSAGAIAPNDLSV